MSFNISFVSLWRLLIAVSAATLLTAASSVPARALEAMWCKGARIRFFVGGAEGDAFGTIVYNGAKQAEADLGPKVDYVFSRWDVEVMTQQASRGHRGETWYRDDGPSRRCRNHAPRRAGG